MKKTKWLLVISLIMIANSCDNTSTTEDNVLPFGLQYGMSSESAYEILDSLTVEGVLMNDEEFGYLYCFPNASKLRVLLGFNNNDELGVIDITNSEMPSKYGGASEKRIRKFLYEQGVNLDNWEKRKPIDKSYEWIHQYSHGESNLTFATNEHYSSVSFKRYDLEAKIVDTIAQRNMEKLEEEIAKLKASGIGGNGTGKVQNSPWDGSVYQVKSYLKKNLNNPKSYESVSWSAVHYDDSANKYYVQHTYRAQNGFGAIVLCTQTFELDSQGNVTNVINM